MQSDAGTLCGKVEVVWCGILKGFVSRSSDKVDENANAANDSLLARHHLLLLILLLRILRSVQLVGTATETKVSGSRRIEDKGRLCELGIMGVTQRPVRCFEKSF